MLNYNSAVATAELQNNKNHIQNFRMWFKYGLKAQKLLAQGIALGIIAISKAPCKGDKFASIISSCITLLSSNSSCSAKHLK